MIRTLPIALVLAAPLAAQWSQSTPANNPGNKSSPAVAHDAGNARTVLFGGLGMAGLSSETWLHDGNDWSLAAPAVSPPARREAAMAYDSARGRVVLFGGRGASGELNDTWEWDGTTWNQRTPANSPSIRQGHVMAYDLVRGVTVLFGGSRNPDFCFPVLRDTWEWNGTDWTRVITANAPSNTVYGGLVYDLARTRLVYYGGTDCGVTDTNTYEYDGVNWTDVSATVGTGPSNFPGIGLSRIGMVYDSQDLVTIVYGGRNEGVGGYSTGTWKYDGTAWAQVQVGVPSLRTGFGMVFDDSRSTGLLYGGTSVAGATAFFNETWGYTCPSATFARFGTGCGGSGGPPPLLNASGVPSLGSTFTLSYVGPSSITPVSVDRPFFLFGFTPLAIPVPAITPLQPSNCTLYVDPIVSVASPLTSSGTGYETTFALSVPNELLFVGVPFFGQVATLFTRTTTGDSFLRFTNRAELVFGF